MISDVAVKFQQVTKFDLRQYFIDYAEFMRSQFPAVRSYFAGNTETIDADAMAMLDSLLSRSDTLLRLFDTFGAKLGNVGYWELNNYCQDLRDTLYRVKKLPKYLRTAKTERGYKPFVQTDFNVGGFRDFRDIARNINDPDITEESLILNNNLEEIDYDIEDMSKASVFLNNKGTAIEVKTVLEQPIGKRVYGRDINRNISFKENDLSTVEFEDNVTQKVKLLLELYNGDVPEFPTFGRTKPIGDNASNFDYSYMISDLQTVFLQNDLFLDVSIEDIYIQQGDLYAAIAIRTKYLFAVKENIRL